MRARVELEFSVAARVVDAVTGLHVIRVDVREPADTAARRGLEVLALLVEEHKVVLWRCVSPCQALRRRRQSTYV